MSIVEYLKKPASAPDVQRLLASLGSPRNDQFGGFQIKDFPAQGVTIYLNESDEIATIFLYEEGRDGHARSVLELPHGLSLEDSMADVRRKLGAPSSSGVGTSKPRDWDKYDFGSYSVHVEYGVGVRRVSLVTLMAKPEAA